MLLSVGARLSRYRPAARDHYPVYLFFLRIFIFLIQCVFASESTRAFSEYAIFYLSLGQLQEQTSGRALAARWYCDVTSLMMSVERRLFATSFDLFYHTYI